MGKKLSSRVGIYNPNRCLLYALLVFSLHSSIHCTDQSEKAAENLQEVGSYIHGVRPGKGTEELYVKLLRRLATVGSIFLVYSIHTYCS